MINKLKTKAQLTEFEKDLNEGAVLKYRNEFISDHNTTNKFYQVIISLFQFEFLKTYLFALFQKILNDEKIEVISFSAIASNSNPVIMAPHIASANNQGLSIVENNCIYADIIFEGNRYQVSVFLKQFDNSGFILLKHFIAISGSEPQSNQIVNLVGYLIAQSQKNSCWKNKILKFKVSEESIDIIEMNRKEFGNENLENIFIPQLQKDELIKFYDCVKNFDSLKYSLRYLFCGPPGTAKTKAIRSLINLCYGEATIIIVDGKTDFSELFRFAELWEPAILCIDDLDLIISNRDESFYDSSLGAFLQELDGFKKSSVFLLATTNDKTLMDRASIRPGRFDLLLDFGKLREENYLDIIKSNCNEEKIIELFNEETLSILTKKKTTGAYLVNLLKQLKIKLLLDSSTDLRKYLNNLITLTYRGFYKSPAEKDNHIGFTNVISGNGLETIDI